MAMKTVIILGAGFGGLTVATELSTTVGEGVRIVLVDRKRTFYECAFNLAVMTGELEDTALAEGDISSLAGRGIEFISEEITGIDTGAMTITTESRSIRGDFIVVALGASYVPEQIPGFAENAYNLYDGQGVKELATALNNFSGGRIAVLVSRTPFKCPAAPYEAAFLIESMLRKKAIREKCTVDMYTPEWAPMPVAGDAVGSEIVGMLRDHNIGYFPDHMVLKVERGRMEFETDEAEFDLLVGVPPHESPSVVREAGLTDATGWIPVDGRTLQTRFPGIYALGDITFIRLHNGMSLPMAGVFAMNEGLAVASSIASSLSGSGTMSGFEGDGFCFIEVGDGMAAYGSGNFYSRPRPSIELASPSAEFKKQKDQFAAMILESLRKE